MSRLAYRCCFRCVDLESHLVEPPSGASLAKRLRTGGYVDAYDDFDSFGMQDASKIWESDYQTTLTEAGLKRGEGHASTKKE